ADSRGRLRTLGRSGGKASSVGIGGSWAGRISPASGAGNWSAGATFAVRGSDWARPIAGRSRIIPAHAATAPPIPPDPRAMEPPPRWASSHLLSGGDGAKLEGCSDYSESDRDAATRGFARGALLRALPSQTRVAASKVLVSG